MCWQTTTILSSTRIMHMHDIGSTLKDCGMTVQYIWTKIRFLCFFNFQFSAGKSTLLFLSSLIFLLLMYMGKKLTCNFSTGIISETAGELLWKASFSFLFSELFLGIILTAFSELVYCAFELLFLSLRFSFETCFDSGIGYQKVGLWLYAGKLHGEI